MIVIADSNLIISALISPKGTVSKIFKSQSNIQFIAPDYLLVEVYEHWVKISKASELKGLNLIKELDYLKSRILFIGLNEIPKVYRLEAYEIVKDIDVDDVAFVALNRYKKHKIWTSDKPLKDGLAKKGYNICISTAELKLKLYKK